MDKIQNFDKDKPYAIVCEGSDDHEFLDKYLSFLAKTDIIDYQLYQIIETNGVNNMTRGMKLYPRYSNYNCIKSFLFVRDADKNAQSAIDSMRFNISDVWQVMLDKSGNIQQSPDGLNIGFFIFPGFDESGNYRDGTLEDLCVDILRMEPESMKTISSLVAVHMEQVVSQTQTKFKTPHKNRLHLIFGSTNDFVGSKIKDVANKHAFDFASATLDTLKGRIISMSQN